MSNLTDALIAAKLMGNGGGGGGGSDVFHLKIVETFTPDDPSDPDSDGTYSYALDKTGAEIDAAINAGKILYCDGVQEADNAFGVRASGICLPIYWEDGVGRIRVCMGEGEAPAKSFGSFSLNFSNSDATQQLTSSYSGRLAFGINTVEYFAMFSNCIIFGLVEPTGDTAFDVYLHAVDGSVTASCEISYDAGTGDASFQITGWYPDPEVDTPAVYGDGTATYTDALKFRIERALLEPKGLADYSSSTQTLGQCLLKYIYEGAYGAFTL